MGERMVLPHFFFSLLLYIFSLDPTFRKRGLFTLGPSLLFVGKLYTTALDRYVWDGMGRDGMGGLAAYFLSLLPVLSSI